MPALSNPSPSADSLRPGGRTTVGMAWRRGRHLMNRAKAALQEGGLSLVMRRFHRWAEHQSDRLFPSRAYTEWIRQNSPTAQQLKQQRAWALSQSEPIRFSIVCPLYKTPLPILEQTLRSVLDQSYPHWELCVTVCAGESVALRECISTFAKQDERIRIVPLEKNAGISQNTNAAIQAASSAWIAFLDHDDLLAPEALFAVTNFLKSNPHADLIYSDEDLIAANGRFRRSPMLKPGWSPEMLLHFNYICHFVVVRRKLIEQIGGLRSEVDGAQDWDLLLRISERTQSIHHIPQILYHWRELSTSTAAHRDVKPYVVEAQKRVVQEHLSRRGISADVEILRNGHCHPRWKSATKPLVSVVIPNKNQPRLIRQAVRGVLERTDYQHTEIIIVDNQSTDPDVLSYYAELSKGARVKLAEYSRPFNYSAACNQGAAIAEGDYLLFLNNDIEIEQGDWLDELLKWAQLPGIGIVGPHLLYPNGQTQHAGLVLGLYGLVGHSFYHAAPETHSPFGFANWVRNTTAVTGACQLIPRGVFQKLGGYDEGYQLLYSDIDLCLRVRHTGFRIVYTPHARLIHHEAATRKPRAEDEKDARRFAELLARLKITEDPYYHPSLSATSVVPQLKPKSGLSAAENLLREIQRYLHIEDTPEARKQAA